MFAAKMLNAQIYHVLIIFTALKMENSLFYRFI